MKRYQDAENVLDYTPTSAKTAGDVVSLGNGLVGIVQCDIPANQLGSVFISGIFRHAKATGVTFGVGDVVYWDATNKKLTNVPQAIALGVAVEYPQNAPANNTEAVFLLVPKFVANPTAGDGIIITENNVVSVGATGISLDKETLALSSATGTITATATPANLPATIVWTSSDETIATVANGTVTRVANGECVITATVNGVASATCAVTASGVE